MDFSLLTIPYLHNHRIWELAEGARSRKWEGQVPVNVDLIIEKGFDIQITPINGLKQLAHAEAFILGSLDEIVYDVNSIDVRLRFSLAHELGHLVLHSKQITLVRPQSFDDWKATVEQIPNDLWARAEYQAREFAGRLLVPIDRLMQEIRNLRGSVARSKREIPDLTNEELAEYVAPRIGRIFNVSGDVIRTRIHREGIDLLNA